jgi:hypothetical protein
MLMMLSDLVRIIGRMGGPPCLESARWSDDDEEGGLNGEGGDVCPSSVGKGTPTGLDRNGLNGGVLLIGEKAMASGLDMVAFINALQWYHDNRWIAS